MMKWLKDICSIENQTLIGKLGYFTSFLATGTNCHCCLGFRILFALLIGLAIGFISLLSIGLSIGLLIGMFVILISAFIVYQLIEENKVESDDR